MLSASECVKSQSVKLLEAGEAAVLAASSITAAPRSVFSLKFGPTEKHLHAGAFEKSHQQQGDNSKRETQRDERQQRAKRG